MAYGSGYVGGYGDVTGLVTSLFIETDPDDWYDATDQLISGSINRGKQNELDRYQAGTMTVVLDNDDRTFDPTFAASPLNGHILPMKRVKLTASWAGTTYPLFLGYADRWTQNREGPRRGTTTLQATDGFKVLERARLASSGFAQEVLADDPVAWWRFDGGTGPVAYDSAGDVDLDQTTGAPEFGTDPLISRDPGASVTLTTADGLWAYGPLPWDEGPLTLEFVFALTGGTGTIFAMYDPAQQTGAALDAQAVVGFQVATGVGTATGCPSTVAYVDGATHHVVCVWKGGSAGSGGGRLHLWVDGVDRTSGTPAISESSFWPEGYTSVGNFPFDTAGVAGVIDEIVVYGTALSDARIAAHYDAVSTPWSGDLPGERIGRVLDAVGWPAGLRDVDTGSTVLQSAALDDSSLEHLQKVAETELGNLYVTADGTLRFEDRASAVNQPVVATFSDAPGGDLPITFSDPEISDEHIRNDVTVSRLEGAARNAQDAASIATYQISSYTRDGLLHTDDDHSLYMAQFFLASYKDPVERVSQMGVNPYRDPDNLWPVVLGLELTDRVVLNETPQLVAPEVSRTLVVDGVAHTFGPQSWSASFNLSESLAATQAYWQLGTAGYSELGQTTRLYF